MILKILKCTGMHYKSWFEAFFVWSFFDYCSSTAAFSKIFSVAEVPARWLSWVTKSVRWNSGTILLYILETFPSLVTISANSAKQQILRSIWRIRKQCTGLTNGYAPEKWDWVAWRVSTLTVKWVIRQSSISSFCF